MKSLLALLFLLPFATRAQEPAKKFILSGKIRHQPDSLQAAWLYLSYKYNGETKIDSVQPHDGHYGSLECWRNLCWQGSG